jgi:hypothetical protein
MQTMFERFNISLCGSSFELLRPVTLPMGLEALSTYRLVAAAFLLPGPAGITGNCDPRWFGTFAAFTGRHVHNSLSLLLW